LPRPLRLFFSGSAGKPSGPGPRGAGSPLRRFCFCARCCCFFALWSRCRQGRRRPRSPLMGSHRPIRLQMTPPHHTPTPLPGFRGKREGTRGPRRDGAPANNSSKIGRALIDKLVGQTGWCRLLLLLLPATECGFINPSPFLIISP